MIQGNVKMRLLLTLNILLYIFLIFELLVDRGTLLGILFRGTGFSFSGARSYNLEPLRSINGYLSVSSAMNVQIFGNFILFVPMGVFVQVSSKRHRFFRSVIMVLVVSLSIEVVQLAFNTGAFDVDDIILNVAGGVSGLVLYQLTYLLCHLDRRKALSMVLAAAGIIPPLAVSLIFSLLSSYGSPQFSFLEGPAIIAVCILYYFILFFSLNGNERFLRFMVLVLAVVMMAFYYNYVSGMY